MLKRMPGTGHHHAAWCPSYEPPDDWTGLGSLLGTAITRDPVDGGSNLRLGFALSSRGHGRAGSVRDNALGGSDLTSGRRLSMLGLLHHLWNEAELNRWKPSFQGKRVWAVVRNRCLGAAADMRVSDKSLASRLYVPEPFTPATWREVETPSLRRFAQIADQGRHLHLLLGELKEFFPLRGTWHAAFKHSPGTTFTLRGALLDQARRRFDRQFTLWSSVPETRLMILATFAANSAGVPEITQLCVQVTDSHWLPIDDAEGFELIHRLTTSKRAFVIPLHYGDSDFSQRAPVAVLTDSGEHAIPIFSQRREAAASRQQR
jgi:hypothetical protein